MFLNLVFKEQDLQYFRHLVLDLNCFCFIQNFELQDECLIFGVLFIENLGIGLFINVVNQK